MPFRDDDPEWFREMYCSECRRRNERCTCEMTFAEKAAHVSMNFYKLRRHREGTRGPRK